jgi:ABC-2 type transport system ATP-binding protein
MEQVFQACVREARDRGQTVLLSSHVLSEVEAVSDRVAMLRQGRIIETGQLDVLRSMAALRVHVVLAEPPPDVSGLPGVSDLVVDDRVLDCQVSGPMDELLRLLAQRGIVHMTTREPSLEELFVSHYGGAQSAAAEPDTSTAP